MSANHEASSPGRLDQRFMAQLIEDVLSIEDHRKAADNPSNRRNLIRAIFAAIEGSVWICREHVRDAAHSLGELTPLIDMALRERTYAVTDRGNVIEQVRSITTRAMIRLVVRQAQRLAPDLSVDLSG